MNTRYVQDWVRRRIANETRVNSTELIDEFIEHAGAHRLQELGKEHVRMVTADIVRGELLRTRRPVGSRKKNLIPGTTTVNLAQTRKWSEFFEFTGTIRVRVMDMTREELLAAASIRNERSVRDRGMVLMELTLAERLGPGMTVRDAFTENDVQRIYEQAMAEAQSEMDVPVLVE